MFKVYQKSPAEDKRMRLYFQKHPRSARAVQLETLCMILRYLYYVEIDRSPAHDFLYDELEAEALQLAGPWSPLHKPGSQLKSGYHEFTITMAKNKEYVNHLIQEVTAIC